MRYRILLAKDVMAEDLTRDPGIALDDTTPEDERRERNPWGPVAVACLVVIAILVILLLVRCDDAPTPPEAANKRIVPVEGYAAEPGLVSVWVSSGSDIERVLRSAELGGRDRFDMGSGRFVVEVPVGQERAALAALAKQQGVYDVGLVYTSEVGEVEEPQ